MTKDEINDYLTTELFGECLHTWRRFAPNAFNSLRFQCTTCFIKAPLEWARPNYFTWEGAGKVIEAMRQKQANLDVGNCSCGVFLVRYESDEVYGLKDVHSHDFREAVCRAAVEFLKGEKA